MQMEFFGSDPMIKSMHSFLTSFEYVLMMGSQSGWRLGEGTPSTILADYLNILITQTAIFNYLFLPNVLNTWLALQVFLVILIN